MKKITLELTKKEYLNLIRLSHIWHMAINWHKVEWQDENINKLQQKIIDTATKNNIKDYLHYFEWSESYDISNEK